VSGKVGALFPGDADQDDFAARTDELAGVKHGRFVARAVDDEINLFVPGFVVERQAFDSPDGGAGLYWGCGSAH
jgi:hypothetical protein